MSIRLFILGTLAKGDNHPYMIRKKLTDVISTPDDRMSEGKFYYNFEALQKKGYIQAIEVIHEENRPDKTLYSITEDGRLALEQGIYDGFKKISNVRDLYICIYLLDFIDPLKAALFFEETIKQEKKRWNDYENLYKGVESIHEGTNKSAQFIIEHAFSKADFNIQWMERLLKFLKEY